MSDVWVDRYSTLTRRTALERGTWMKRTAFVKKPRRSEYGGAGWRKFREQILERDRHACQWCLRAPAVLHVHHLKRVGMGGSKSANVPENAITLCAEHHQSHHESDKPTREQLRDRMLNLGHIVLLSDAELDETDARLGIVR